MTQERIRTLAQVDEEMTLAKRRFDVLDGKRLAICDEMGEIVKEIEKLELQRKRLAKLEGADETSPSNVDRRIAPRLCD